MGLWATSQGRVDERVIEADERSVCRDWADPVHRPMLGVCQPANWLLTWARERSRCAVCAATAARVSRTRSAAIRAACSLVDVTVVGTVLEIQSL